MDGPCHISTIVKDTRDTFGAPQTTQMIFVANYGAGKIGVHTARPDGTLGQATCTIAHGPGASTKAFLAALVVRSVSSYCVANLALRSATTLTYLPVAMRSAPGVGRQDKAHPHGKDRGDLVLAHFDILVVLLRRAPSGEENH